MWKMVGKPSVVKGTPGLAKRFAEMEPCPEDRNMKPRIMQYLRNAVLDGQFRTCEWAEAYCKETKKTYRVNGKHTSHIFSQLNGQAGDWTVVLTKYECDTLEDVAKLYSTFDRRDSGRTTGDINRVFQMSDPDLAEIAHRTVNLAVTGIAMAMWEDAAHQKTVEERAELMFAHHNFVIWLNKMFYNEDVKHLWRGPVVAAMFKTFQKAQGAATEFWTAVRDGTGAKPTTPDRRLNKYLLSASVGHGRYTTRLPGRAGRREMFVKCLHAWNAWRKGEDTNLNYYASAKTPAAV